MDQNLLNLLGLARTALLANNNPEAESYFNRVLEIDPTISEAWIGKGTAAGWQSTLNHLRLSEMLVAFSHALGTVPAEQRDASLKKCVSEVNGVVSALYSMARKHMLEFIELPKTWPEYVQQIAQLIDSVDAILAWDPRNEITLQNMVQLCKDNIEGVAYRDKFDNNLPKALSISPEYEALLQRKLKSAASELQLLNSAYQPPVPQKKEADWCFVVTASVGRGNHPALTLLREFRDARLKRSMLGAAFIKWYYRHGPNIAALISRSLVLRKMSFVIVVLPACIVAKAMLAGNHTTRHRPLE